jgi:hypothetical protein
MLRSVKAHRSAQRGAALDPEVDLLDPVTVPVAR